jgi:hypothetical protein
VAYVPGRRSSVVSGPLSDTPVQLIVLSAFSGSDRKKQSYPGRRRGKGQAPCLSKWQSPDADGRIPIIPAWKRGWIRTC